MEMSKDDAVYAILNARPDEDTASWWDIVLSEETDIREISPKDRTTSEVDTQKANPIIDMPTLDATKPPTTGANGQNSPPPLVPIRTPRPVPKVGTVLQRSGNAGERKLLELAGQPPLPARTKKRTPIKIQPVTWAEKRCPRQDHASSIRLRITNIEVLEKRIVMRPPPARIGVTATSAPPTTEIQSEKRADIWPSPIQRAASAALTAAPNASSTVPAELMSAAFREMQSQPENQQSQQKPKDAERLETTASPGQIQTEQWVGMNASTVTTVNTEPTVNQDRTERQVKPTGSTSTLKFRTALPPVGVEIEPGRIIEVPHKAVYHIRAYRAKLSDGRWRLRFDHTGKCRYIKHLG